MATKIGLPEEGFDIEFDSDTDVIGAFIQFKATDAAVASSYFDVNLLQNADAPQTGSKSIFKSKSKQQQGLSRKILMDNPINIDFTPQLQTGEICYVICVYDNAGNISDPQEVCINVNSWGGNEDLVGTWNLTRNESISAEGTDTETVGIEDCESSSTFCRLIEFWTLNLNADGTFENSIKEFEREEAVEPDFVDFSIETVGGNWSYDSTSETLTLAIYFERYEETGEEDESETFPIGDADVFSVQRIVIDAASLELIWNEADTDGDGTIDESYIEYYER